LNPTPTTGNTGTANLPAPDSEAAEHSTVLLAHIRERIAQAGGWISFADYMALCLYAPALGYYMAGARKLGADGDFITAPELSPLFGQCLAQWLMRSDGVMQPDSDGILEIGAGSGVLAAAMLEELEQQQALPARYFILELSAELRQRARDTLAARVPHLLERVTWLNQLPPQFHGLVLGNEVLDALPCELLRLHQGQAWQRGVICTDHGLAFSDRPLSLDDGALGQQAATLLQQLGDACASQAYVTEVQLQAQGLMRSLGAMLHHGAVLMIDYGFAASEYYHAQRNRGTLMCHYRHRSHDDPFFWPGLQDITCHVDFSAMINAAKASGLDCLGFTSQAGFLLHSGLIDLVQRVPVDDQARYLGMSNVVNRLTSPAEMGELFKVIALMPAANATTVLPGFVHQRQV
jgi:SAM-dependent MidA family methyltransferase